MNQKLILLGENLADVVHFFIFIELKLISSPCQMVYAIELTTMLSAALGFSETDHFLTHYNLRICEDFYSYCKH